MKKQLLKILIIGFYSILFSNEAFCSHAAGMDITYKYVGPQNATTNLQYEITVNFYYDCENGGSTNLPYEIKWEEWVNEFKNKPFIYTGIVTLIK